LGRLEDRRIDVFDTARAVNASVSIRPCIQENDENRAATGLPQFPGNFSRVEMGAGAGPLPSEALDDFL